MRAPGRVIILSLFLLCVCLRYVCALEVPEHPRGRITDFTSTLSLNEISFLEKKLADFENKTTNQIAVLMIPSLKGDNLEDYSIRLADKWMIGQKGKDNGVILLIVKNDRKLRIEVGYGLEGVLPDGLAGSIIRNEIAPLFKKGQFFNGIHRGTDAIIKATNPSFRPTKPHGGPAPTTDSDLSWPLKIIAILILVAFAIILQLLHYSFNIILSYFRWSKGKRKEPFWGNVWRYARKPIKGRRRRRRRSSRDGFLGGFLSGGGGSCGGFSGGGGGFGGGGASGDW